MIARTKSRRASMALPLLAVLLLATAPARAARAADAPRAAKSATVRAQLPNGLSVIIVPTSRLPLVDFRLVARAGSVNDPTGR